MIRKEPKYTTLKKKLDHRTKNLKNIPRAITYLKELKLYIFKLLRRKRKKRTNKDKPGQHLG